MLLSIRMLNGVGSVNNFEYVSSVEFTEGDAPTIYFQLVDMSVDKLLRPAGRRYMPASGATLQCVIKNIENFDPTHDHSITRYATQPYAADPSIWQLVLMPTDRIRGTCSISLLLTEGMVITRGLGSNVISAKSQNQAF